MNNSVKVKVGKQFLKLVRLHFHKNKDWGKIFNKGTIKLSYRCMPNMKSIINSHNHKVLRSNVTTKTCNYKKETTCPFNGKCLLRGKYKVTLQIGNETKEYIGSTGVYFKQGTLNTNIVSNLVIDHILPYLNM